MGLRLKSIFQSVPAIRTYVNLATSTEVLEGRHTKVSELKNGFRVATHNNGRATATIGIWVDSGSRYENTNNNGVAYFLEHLLYKGTKSRTQRQLELDLARLGARFDSYTDREHTAYFIQSPSSEVNKVFEILADAVRNSPFNTETIEVERKVLLKKLDEHDANTRERVFDYLNLTAFQGTALALSPYGHSKSLESITAEDLRNFAQDTYKPTRMVATAVGGVDHDQIAGLSEKLFGDLQHTYDRKTPQVSASVRFTGSEMKYRDDNYPFLYAAFAVEGVPTGHPDALPLSVAQQFIGQWDKTHATFENAPNALTQDLIVNHEIESFEGFNINYKDTGLFGVYTVLKGQDIDTCWDVTKKLQKRWKYLSTGLQNDEVDRAKNQLRTQLFSKLETNAKFADHISKELLNTGRVTQLEELARNINYIDANQVREAASRHVYDRDLAIVVVGKTEAWPTYHWLRYAMSSWRV